jgi:hypothetical protein
MLDLKACRFVPEPAPEGLPTFTHGAIRVPGAGGGAAAGVVTLPVRAHGRDLGHFVLVFPAPTVGVGIPTDTRHAALALADQLGVALLRYRRP